MDVIGSKLNKVRNQKGLSLVEVLVSVVLLGTFASMLNLFTVSTFSSMKMMRAENFVRIFNVNIDQLLNSRAACVNTFGADAIADGDVINPLRNAANAGVLNIPTANINNSNVDILSATVANRNTTGLNLRFNLQITYQYNTFNPAQQMVKVIPMIGLLDASNNVVWCSSARAFSPDNLFIRSDINDTKTGALTITGDLTFNYSGGADVLSKLVIVPQVANPMPLTTPATSIFIPSDRNLKKDIEPIHLSKNGFEDLHAYRYKFKGQDNYSIGFLSQEVQKFSPESVDAPKDSYMAVNYDAMLPYVWEYHKQVYHKNIELQGRLKALEEKIDKMK